MRNLIEVDKAIEGVKEIDFISQQDKKLTNKKFIEEFTASIFTNILILRDEGFLLNDMSVNVGSDGSMQWEKNEKGSILLRCPAIIPNNEIQKEILRCLTIVTSAYENNSIDEIALLQAKAKNNYTFKRALVHYTLRNN